MAARKKTPEPTPEPEAQTPAAPAKIRPVQGGKDVTITVPTPGPGPGFNMQVNVEPVEKPGRSKEAGGTKLACPTCATADKPVASPMTQGYTCGNDATHTGFSNEQCVRAVEADDGTLRLIGTNEQVKATREAAEDGLEKGWLDLHVHRYDEVSATTVPGGTAMIVTPVGKANEQAIHAALLDVIGDDGRIDTPNGDVCLLGRVRMARSNHLVRVQRMNGRLVLVPMVSPEKVRDDLAVRPPVPPVDNALPAAIATAYGETAEPFDPTRYADTRVAAVEALKAAALSGDLAVDLSAIPDKPAAAADEQASVESLAAMFGAAS